MDGINREIQPGLRWWPMYAILAGSFIGILDAGYLTYEHYAGKNLKCFIAQGCDAVTTSKYSELAGLPLSAFGAVFYLGVFVMALIMIDTNNTSWHSLILFGSALAFAVSVVLVYLQLFVLQAICTYCMGSAFVSTLIFACALLFRRFLKQWPQV